MEAINLYMKSGLPSRAARLAMSREVIALVVKIFISCFSTEKISQLILLECTTTWRQSYLGLVEL